MIRDWLLINPRASIIFLSVLITFFMTIVTKYTTNQDRMRELKKVQKACNLKMRENRHDREAVSKIQKEMWACSSELMKYSFKPLFITLIPLLIFFWWIRGIYAEVFTSWLWWYIGSGIISSIFIRKALKVV